MIADLRLAIPAAAAWAILAVVLSWPGSMLALAIGFWALSVLAVVLAILLRGSESRPSRWRAALSVTAVVFTATALLLSSAAAHERQRHPDELVKAASASRFVTATATTAAAIAPGADQFDATLTVVTMGGETLDVEVPVTIFGTVDDSRSVGIGSTVTVSGTLAATDPAETSAFLFFARGDPVITAGSPWYLDWANQLRAGFRDAAVVLPGDGGDLLPGLAIGDTSAVSHELNQAMKSSSLSHLTAVSGANCAVVIGLIMLAGGALGLGRGWRIGLSSAVLVAFVILVTPEPSVLRAAVMAGLVLAALAVGRPVRGLSVLSLAVIVLLVWDPWLARDYGFVLSVLATGGLLVLARPLTQVLARWLPLSVSAVIAIPLAAQLACQPVLLMLNATIPTYGVVANVLAEPAAPIATVLGLVACLLVPWFPFGANLVARIAWVPSSWIVAVAHFFTVLPGNAIPWAPGVAGVVLLSAITVLALVVVLRPDDRGRRWRRIAAAALALILVCYAGLAVGDEVRRRVSRPSDWEIAACDIGQGDAVLVRSGGEIALVDTGPDPALLTKCLDILGIGHIDLLILSHYDLDHVGGTSAVFGKVTRVLVGPPVDDKDRRLSQQLVDAGAALHQTSQGESGRLGDLRWSILWPKAKLGGVEPGNDASVTVAFDGVGTCADGCLSALFLGDLGEEPQARMMAANRLGYFDVVKVAHHGSADQNPRLYDAIEAKVGVISVGAGNSYGHPTDHLLSILQQAGTLAERTDLEGMILLSPRADGRVSVWSERPAGASK